MIQSNAGLVAAKRFVGDKKKITYACFIFFIIWRAVLIIHYNGWYAFDETYHLSSSNPEFYYTSKYAYAPYLNFIIHILSSVFGKSYYVFKFIPFSLSVISAGMLLYVIYRLAEHIQSIVMFMFIMCFHSIIIFNHMYIRSYVFDELVFSVLIFLFYQMSQTKCLRVRAVIIVLYVIVALSLAWLCPADLTDKAIAVFGVLALILNSILDKIIPRLRGKRYIRWIICVFFLLAIGVEGLIIAYRSGKVAISLPEEIANMFFPYGYSNYPWFTQNFYMGGIGLTIGIILYGYYIICKKEDYSDNVIGIYCLAMLPFIVYNMVYYDCFPMRVYASYLPALVLAAVLGLDRLPARNPYRFLILCLALLAVVKAQAGVGIIQFFREPYIYKETNFNNYGEQIKDAEEAVKNGRICIAIWSNEHQKAAFELPAEYVIAMEDSTNVPNGYTEEDLNILLEYLLQTDEPHVLLVGTHCYWRLDALSENFLATLGSLYPYRIYEKDAYLFYIN